MSRLVVADPSHIKSIYRESYALWGAGLTRRDYLGLWNEISSTAWARENARFYVWLGPGGEVLSSLKAYRPKLQLLGECGRAIVLGAIFTPRARRRRGHAAAAVRAALDVGREDGSNVALLFSDIGTRYYDTFGFREIPAEEQWGPLSAGTDDTPAGWTLRDMRDEDLSTVIAMHDAFCAARPFAVLRDPAHWEFVRTRAFGFFRRLGSAQVRQRWRVAECDGRVVGYLITVEGRGEWNVREVGALGGDFEGMADVLRVAAVEAARSGLRRFYAWLPRELVAHLSGWRIRSSSRRGAVPMIAALDGMAEFPALQVPGAAYIPYQDQF
ncbi:MAG: GNAT family N-acetyltransferase [Acidobacteria bacterium]|nr:GNAT family N-acetyltransferase [Acidobacteriota bacterium]NIM63743.1 GNAT family N-acetyltransferase [Acidobacteriota bacterium]NIO59312.1 GNAT family N-acetyltransferase [Acidobacteriota bacterium]NIQ30326.1 GNAT family N-acetyltransferase [Acidobacteriota bacterium]NIQ85263.1 GNAT family N-acetyltransferase [Acidobacteriota bacterium]